MTTIGRAVFIAGLAAVFITLLFMTASTLYLAQPTVIQRDDGEIVYPKRIGVKPWQSAMIWSMASATGLAAGIATFVNMRTKSVK